MWRAPSGARATHVTMQQSEEWRESRSSAIQIAQNKGTLAVAPALPIIIFVHSIACDANSDRDHWAYDQSDR